MTRCNIITTTRVVNPQNLGSIPWEALPQETVARCMTHNMPIEGTCSLGDLCPVGKIEEATEKALKLISEASERT